MASQQTITARQLTRAREAQFHRNGEPLQTTEAIREWIEAAGLLPVYPLSQFHAPMPSFAEAVLGRTENNWVAPSKRRASASAEENQSGESPDGSDDESYKLDVEDEEGDDEPEDDYASDDDEDSIDEDEEGDEDSIDEDDESDEDEPGADPEDVADDSSDELEPPTAEGDQAMLAGDGNIPTDPETILSNDDEFAEDEGDEIAEEDRIHAGGDPLPNDLREGSTSSEGAEVDQDAEAEPATPAVNGFSPEERETVSRALARLVEDGTVVPLNLLGGATGEPDYLVPASAFSFVYTLRGDKNWKNEPATTGPMRVSPLAVKVFGLLKEKGAKAPHELTVLLGQGITDSATLRALNELWAIQRVIPLPNADGAPAKWELITSKFLRPMKAGANAGQPTALSALLSLYLHQAIAATGDDIEVFLSPLAARSRVREVVHGLSASRQLDEIVVEGKTLLHIAGELPALPADDVRANASEAGAPQRSRYEQDDRRAAMEERRERFGDRGEGRPARRPSADRGEGRGSRPSFGDRKPFGDRPSGGAGERERRPFQRRENTGQRSGFVPRDRGNFAPRSDREGGAPRERNSYAQPWNDDRPRRAEGDAERRPFTPREDRGERRPFTPREGGERRPYTPREGGDRPGYVPRGDRPYGNREDRGGFQPRGGGGDRPYERRPFGADRDGGSQDRGERQAFTPREGGERRPFTPREGGERRPFTPRWDREGGFAPRRPFTPREGGERRPFTPREGGERRPFVPRDGGERRPFVPREGGERRPFTPRGDRDGGFAPRRPFVPREGGGERRPFVPREGGERRPFTPREGGERRPFAPREGGFNRGGDRPSGGNRPAFGGRPRPDREGGPERREGSFDRAAGGFGDRKRFSGEPGAGRPNFQSGAHSAGPGGSKFGGSGFGRDRGGKGAPGKFGKPGFKPSFRGPGSGPARGGAPKRRPE